MTTTREILEQVQSGRLSPEDAAMRLEQAAQVEAPGVEPAPPTEAAPPSPDQKAHKIRKIKVLGDFRSTRITGDADVTAAVVDGPHLMREEGGMLVIDARQNEDGDGFRFETKRKRLVIGLGQRPETVTIRMNPDLPLDVAIDAGSATISGVRAAIKANIDAGTIKVEGTESPFDLSVDAGTVNVSARLTDGDSKISCDAGSIKVQLRKGSSVRVKASADLGAVRLGSEASSGLQLGSHSHEAVFGGGDATLTISGSIGRVVVDEE